jgi:mRNA interferase MazF
MVSGNHLHRREIWWADLPHARGSEPGFRRPVLIIQADAFNQSRIKTVIAAVITSNLELARAPGNVLLSARISRLPKDSVVNVSQLVTIDRRYLSERVGSVSGQSWSAVEAGLRLVLEL